MLDDQCAHRRRSGSGVRLARCVGPVPLARCVRPTLRAGLRPVLRTLPVAGLVATGLVAACLVVCLVGVTAPAHAQWVEPPGEGWLALAVYHQDTGEQFGIDGDPRSLFADGRAVTTSSFLTAATGIVRGVDLWAQLSFHRLRYDDLAGDRQSTGPGDVRVWLRVAPLAGVLPSLPFAVRGGVKMPVGDFDVDADVVPLGDGQRDWELLAEVGHSFWPRSMYLTGWIGYRWREANRQSHKDFGDEVFWLAQAGGSVGPVGLRLTLDGWDGASGVTEGIPVPSFQRDLIQLQPTVLGDLGPGQIEVGARFALAGRNLPRGTAWMAQYFTRWEPFKR